MEHQQNLANCHGHLGSPQCCECDTFLDSYFKAILELTAEFQFVKESVLCDLGLLYGSCSPSGDESGFCFNFLPE